MQNPEFSINHPEGTLQERLWNSVVMDYPFFGGRPVEQSAYRQATRIGEFASGKLSETPEHLQNYILRWIAAGFTPELYWAVSSGIREAAAHARRRCKSPEDLLRLEDRMRRLGILAPNPRAGQLYKELQRDERGGAVLVDRCYPAHVVQLEPEEWAEFPQRLLFNRPSTALQQFVYGDPLHQGITN